ncbi:MAG: aminotransferase class V-fold PLP-dependent enzyme [Anaerolineae bacterium]
MIYFDNAATSWPKPARVVEALCHFITEVGANPGRSAHRLSIEAGRTIYETREALAQLFNVGDPLRIVLGLNATEALNLALCGILRRGDHVITSSMEHNSVMRPLRALEAQGVIELDVMQCSSEGFLDPSDLEAAIGPDSRMIVLNHASNVVGSLLPVAEAGAIARNHDVLLLVDAAQTAGAYPLDMKAMQIDLLAFTGHKALFGPQGTGGLCLGERVAVDDLRPLKRGGTGSGSDQEEQPDFLPDKYESGTPNAVGLAGLGAGVEFVLEQGVEAIRAHEVELTRQLIAGLLDIPGVTPYGGHDAEMQVASVSFNVEGVAPSKVAALLDERYEIMSRVGLHCAPAAHRTIGTFPVGAVRFGLSYLNTAQEVEAALKAAREIARGES